MGNTSKKLAAKCTLLTKDEQKSVAATFRAASKNSDKIREDDLIVSQTIDAQSLEKLWGPQIDPRLAQYLTNFLFGFGQNKTPTCDFNRFAELYVYNVRGSVDERMLVTYNSLGMDYNDSLELPYQLLREYCESITSTYIRIVKASSDRTSNMWIEKGFRGSASHVQALGEAVAATIGDMDNPQNQCSSQQLHRWLQANTLLKAMAELVFINLYGVDRHKDDSPTHVPTSVRSLLPVPDGIDAMPDYPAFIDISHIVWLNSHLPRMHQHKWRFLFSSHVHGESFSTMAGRIQDAGPSLLIIKDNSGYIFGGYAAESWIMGPTFYGNEDAFLFTCAPKMRVYPSTTYNDHYQYINHHTKTLPNGLLMGGQFEFGGIWVNADPFGQGSSAESCSTFRGYKRLSKDPNFHIKSLEVWGVGDKPLTVKESMTSVTSRRSSVLETHKSDRNFLQLVGKPQDERDVSILDTNPEAKAILDMAGRTRHSEGIREPPPL